MDSIQLHLDIENSLNQTLKETKLAMDNFNSLLEKAQNNFTGISKTGEVVSDNVDEIADDMERASKASSHFKDAFSKIGVFAKRAIGTIGGLFGSLGIMDAVKSAMDLETSMRHLGMRMGMTAKQARILKTETFSIAKATGLTVEQSSELVGALTRMRVPIQNIEQLGKDSAYFAKITGVSADSANRLTGELVRTGRLGAKGTENVLTAMANMQHAVGMTESEMEVLTDTTIEATRVLRQYGKSAEFIETFNKGVVRLSGAFASVGVSAERAKQFVDDLLDPEKIEDNAMLYAKLGVSIQDVIAGNVDMANLTPKFKELGEQIKGMSVMAGSALAKQLGMSRRELVAMADIDLTKGMGGKEGLEGMFKKSLSPQEKMQKMMNDMQVRMTEFADTLQNKIMDIIPKIEGMINKIMGLFGNKKMWIAGLIALVGIIGVIAMAMRKKFYAVAEDFKKTLTTATEEAIVMGTEKAAKVAETGIATRGGKTSKMQRIISSEQYKQVQGVAEMFDVMAKSNLFPSVRRMTENTADWLRTISMGSKKVSLLKILSEENYKSIKETLEARKQENAMLSNVYEDRKKELEDRIKIYQIRMEEVKGTKEAVWLNKQIAKMTNETGRLQDKINQTERNTEQLQEKFLRKVGKEQLADMYKQLELEKTRQQGLLEANKQRRAELRIQNELLSREAKALTNRRNELQTSDNLTAEQAMELEKINSVLNEINGKRKAIVAEGKESLLNDKEALEQIQKINDEMTDIKKAAGGTDLSKVGKSLMPEGPIKRITNFVGSVFHKAGSGITNAFDKARKSAKQMGTDIVEKLKPTNWLKSIKAKLRGFGDKEAQENAKAMTGVSKGMGKLGGLMKKLAIPMMIMGLVMKAIQPIIETLQPILKTIVDVIGDVLKDLAKKLLPPILRLLAKFFPMIVLLVNKLLPPILWLLGQIVKILGMLVGAIGTLLQGMLTLPIKIAAGIDKIMHPLKYRGKSADEIAQEKIEQLRETSPLYKAAFGFTDVVKELGTEIGSIGDEIIGTGKYYMKHDIITKEAQDKIVGAMEKAADNIEKGNFAKKEETAGTAAAAAAPSAGSAALFVAGAGGTITKESDAKKAEAINAKKTAENTEKSAEAEQVQVNIMQEQNETLKKLNNTMAELLNYMKRKDIPTVGATPTAATVS